MPTLQRKIGFLKNKQDYIYINIRQLSRNIYLKVVSISMYQSKKNQTELCIYCLSGFLNPAIGIFPYCFLNSVISGTISESFTCSYISFLDLLLMCIKTSNNYQNSYIPPALLKIWPF